MDGNVPFTDMMAVMHIVFVMLFHCAPLPNFFPSNTAVREAFLCEGQRDDEEMYARLSKATLEGPWGTFADGSSRGKLLSKMQVCSHMTPPPPLSHYACRRWS